MDFPSASRLADIPAVGGDEIRHRRQSLAHALETRADRTTLLERNILHSTASPYAYPCHPVFIYHPQTQPPSMTSLTHPNSALQAAQDKLSFHRRADSLDKALKTRPRRQDLVREGILYSNCATPSIHARIHELEWNMARDRLDRALSKRPDRSDLVREGILYSASAMPAIHGRIHDLERNMARDRLDQALMRRPSVDVLLDRGILTSAGAFSSQSDVDSRPSF